MTLQQLINENYTILNGEISKFVLRIKDDSTLVYNVIIQGDGWGCNYGDYDLLSYDYKVNGAEALFTLLKTIGVDSTDKIVGKAVRIAFKDPSEPVQFIGNIVYDIWFNFMEENEVLSEFPDKLDEIDVKEEEEEKEIPQKIAVEEKYTEGEE